MSRYVLTPAAESDLDDIWDYTSTAWSEAQAEKYIHTIRTACEDLASGRKAGQSIEAFRAGYWRHPAGAHFIFFRRPSDDFIEIVRILHQRMDIPSRL